MATTTMFERSNTHVRFGNKDMDFVFQWMLGYHTYGGAAYGELFHTASQIQDGDPESWIVAFLALGERLRHHASALHQAGNIVSAYQTFLRTFCGYRAALQLMNPRADARFAPTVAALRQCFAAAIPGFDHPCAPIRIPWDQSYLSGYFYRVHPQSRSCPTLIVIGGGDTYAEDLHFWAGAAGPRRGYNVLAVDLPGQGDSPTRGLYFRPDIEAPMRAVVDYALSQPEIDGTRLATYGISGGGYIVTRAMAFETRIKAAIADTPIHDLHRLITTAIPAVLLNSPHQGFSNWILKVAGKRNHVGQNNIDKFAWQAGTRSLLEAVDLYQHNAQVDVRRITGPMLCLAGAGDPPECLKQTQEVFDALPNPCKAMRVLTAQDGAEAHCHVNNFPLLHHIVFDWLDNVFGIKQP